MVVMVHKIVYNCARFGRQFTVYVLCMRVCMCVIVYVYVYVLKKCPPHRQDILCSLSIQFSNTHPFSNIIGAV